MKKTKSSLWLIPAFAFTLACNQSTSENNSAADSDVDETRESNVVQPAEAPMNPTTANDNAATPDTAQVQHGLDTSVYHGNATERR